MIAVFTRKQEYFDRICAKPKDQFVRINSEYDLIGKHFSGVIFLYDWTQDKDAVEAYKLLRIRQPELFK